MISNIRPCRPGKSGNKSLNKKIEKLLDELRSHPESGTGKPERLKHDFTGYWSRRINREHRLIYSIEDQRVIVTVISAFGHYMG
jgi:toxin YoeB